MTPDEALVALCLAVADEDGDGHGEWTGYAHTTLEYPLMAESRSPDNEHDRYVLESFAWCSRLQEAMKAAIALMVDPAALRDRAAAIERAAEDAEEARRVDELRVTSWSNEDDGSRTVATSCVCGRDAVSRYYALEDYSLSWRWQTIQCPTCNRARLWTVGETQDPHAREVTP